MKINYDNVSKITSEIRVPPTTGDPLSSRHRHQAPPVPGQQVTGEVLARLSDQLYLLRIAGDIYRSELPVPLRPGDPIQLTFRTNEPSPSFDLRGITFNASPVRLSPTASWLNNLMTDTTAIQPGQRPPAFAPLSTTQPLDPALFARSLRNSLTLSGLFYESHLLQWHLGERLLAEIMQEPQARFPSFPGRARGGRVHVAPSEEEGIPPQENATISTATGEPSPTDMAEELVGFASPAAIPIIREQVTILLTGLLRWHGEVWPDQEMEWVVDRGDDGSSDAVEPCWRTQLRLQLPNLGSVCATLTFTAGEIRGAVRTDSTTTAEYMKDELERLRRGMNESGLQLREMVIDGE